jgi:hypothetical protein
MKFPKLNIKTLAISFVVLMISFLVISFGFMFFVTPNRFAFPQQDHFHFRLQYVHHGKVVDFGDEKYQVEYTKDICSDGLTKSPIHLHDDKDQIVHIHWQKITGGDILKYYGINQVGGLSDSMGFRLDKLFQFNFTDINVPIHGQNLPKVDPDDKFFVYVGDKDSYQKKDWNQFLNQSLEDFVGKNSIFREQLEEVKQLEGKLGFNLLQSVNVIASTNPQSGGGHDNGQGNKTEDELKKINNLIGNVVIFVQNNQPTAEEIKTRFNNLEPLGLSACGG